MGCGIGHPYDLCNAPDGGLWVLTRDPDTDLARVWYLDPGFRLREWSGDVVEYPVRPSHDFCADDPQPEEAGGASGTRRFFSGISLTAVLIGPFLIPVHPLKDTLPEEDLAKLKRLLNW